MDKRPEPDTLDSAAYQGDKSRHQAPTLAVKSFYFSYLYHQSGLLSGLGPRRLHPLGLDYGLDEFFLVLGDFENILIVLLVR